MNDETRFCLWKHFKAFYEQCMENKKADKIDFLKQGKRGSNPR